MLHAYVCAELLQLCPTLCDPVDCNPEPPGSSVHGILWARILECVVSFPSPEDFPNPGIKPESHVFCIGRRVLYC